MHHFLKLDQRASFNHPIPAQTRTNQGSLGDEIRRWNYFMRLITTKGHSKSSGTVAPWNLALFLFILHYMTNKSWRVPSASCLMKPNGDICHGIIVRWLAETRYHLLPSLAYMNFLYKECYYIYTTNKSHDAVVLYPSETHLNLKASKILFDHNIFLSC